MFERFSDSAIRAIMLAQEKARTLGLSCIDSDVMLYGLLAEGTSKAAQILAKAGLNLSVLDAALKDKYPTANDFVGIEIQFSADVEKALSRARTRSDYVGSQVVEPEHILRELTMYPVVYSLFPSSSMTHPKPIAAAGSATRPPKTLTEWFTTEAIQVVSQAEERARADGSAHITVDHMLSALILECSWVPSQVLAGFGLTDARSDVLFGGQSGGRFVAPAEGKAKAKANAKANVNAQATAKATAKAKVKTRAPSNMSFASETSLVFVKAQAEAAQRLCSSIGPENLLLGLLKSVADGTVHSALLPATSADQLYSQVNEALSDFLNAQAPPRKQTFVEPLEVDTDRVLATKRFVSTIRRALEFAHESKEKRVEVPHLVMALIESARTSEVTFVENHTQSLNLVEAAIAKRSPATHARTKGKAFVTDTLESIARRAADHARRLQSNRLDINHLGLALLDEDNGAVDSVVNALGAQNNRGSMRRRLDWCLHYQRFQNGYQAEPGVVIDLRELNRLYPA